MTQQRVDEGFVSSLRFLLAPDESEQSVGYGV